VAERFLLLPNIYWLDGWHEELDLPATVMLLVALHERDGFKLPTERMPQWYGWSADTAERGLASLAKLEILSVTTRMTKAPLSPTGLAKTNEYTLQPLWRPVSKAPAVNKSGRGAT